MSSSFALPASYEDRAGRRRYRFVRQGAARDDEDDLVREALPRLDALIAEGVTTVEVKSGYGLDTENELRSLRAAAASPRSATSPCAHDLPRRPCAAASEHGDKIAYIKKVVTEMLPAVAAEGLADAVDGFCEGIAFSTAEMTEVFEAAKAVACRSSFMPTSLALRRNSPPVATRFDPDHPRIPTVWAAAMAKAGTVTVILPGAFYFIRETKKPPVRSLPQARRPDGRRNRRQSGTSPLTSLPPHHEHGRNPLRHDRRGMHRPERRAKPPARSGWSTRWGRWRPENGADFVLWDIGRPAGTGLSHGLQPHARPHPQRKSFSQAAALAASNEP